MLTRVKLALRITTDALSIVLACLSAYIEWRNDEQEQDVGGGEEREGRRTTRSVICKEEAATCP